ncbi:MAG TPA: CdaR family protein [Candidatus Binataceae bacterium]|nr:CdaR family protein [Candidatus Binataceae bacterium]
MPNITGPLRPLEKGSTARIAARSRQPWVTRLARMLLRDAGLRLLSVALAIGLWIFVNAGQHSSFRSFDVPISYLDLPPGYAVTSRHPDFVRVQVTGPLTLLSIIDPTHLRLRLDLNGVGIGQASFKIAPDAFAVPRHTEVTGVSPSQIVLEIDKIVTRAIPVHLALLGAPAAGYKIASTEVTPPTVAVRGPSRAIAHIDEINTAPLAVGGLSSDFSRTVDLLAPTAGRLLADEVTAKVSLTPLVTQKPFRNVPISVRDTNLKFHLDTHRVRVDLSGPLLTLQKVDLKGAVYVEAAGLAPGTYSAPVQINLPEGVALVRQAPEKVTLRIYRDK